MREMMRLAVDGDKHIGQTREDIFDACALVGGTFLFVEAYVAINIDAVAAE